MFGNLPLAIIPNPAGTFHFVGRVPSELAFEIQAPADVEAELIRVACLCGPGFARDRAKALGFHFKTRTFATEAQARAFAEARGFTPQ